VAAEGHGVQVGVVHRLHPAAEVQGVQVVVVAHQVVAEDKNKTFRSSSDIRREPIKHNRPEIIFQ
jgi:hypothetical protein